MADNYTAKNASGSNVTFDSKDIGGGVQRVRHEISSAPAGAMTDVGDSTSVTKVITDTDGTLLGYLRGVIYFLLNRLAPLGQAAMADSHPVAIANDQPAITITGTVLNGGPGFEQGFTPSSFADLTSIDDVSDAPDSGAQLVVESVSISAATAMVVELKEETTGALVKRFNLTSGNLNAEWNPTNGLKLPNINKKLQAVSDTVGQVDLTVVFHSA
jgi:hypothetical protein